MEPVGRTFEQIDHLNSVVLWLSIHLASSAVSQSVFPLSVPQGRDSDEKAKNGAWISLSESLRSTKTIDCLEAKTGVVDGVQLHESMNFVRCRACSVCGRVYRYLCTDSAGT